MGLIKALTGSVGGVLADQWKEYIRCERVCFQSLAFNPIFFQKLIIFFKAIFIIISISKHKKSLLCGR